MWQRKAQMCGIQMVPIPSDLLALPFTLKSDPLRGPIFIPLNTECLMANKRHLFEGLLSQYQRELKRYIERMVIND